MIISDLVDHMRQVQGEIYRIIRNDTYRNSHYCGFVAVAWQQVVATGMINGSQYSVNLVLCVRLNYYCTCWFDYWCC